MGYCGQAEKIWKHQTMKCCRSAVRRWVITRLEYSSGEANCNFILGGGKKGFVNYGLWVFEPYSKGNLVEGSEARPFISDCSSLWRWRSFCLIGSVTRLQTGLREIVLRFSVWEVTYLFSKVSVGALRPIDPLVEWVPRDLSPEKIGRTVNLTALTHLLPKLRMPLWRAHGCLYLYHLYHVINTGFWAG
jgi:hypothetical protein